MQGGPTLGCPSCLSIRYSATRWMPSPLVPSIYGEGIGPLPVARCVRYGRLTVVPSPDAEMLNVPFAVLGEYE
jgi:hypothetical protein